MRGLGILAAGAAALALAIGGSAAAEKVTVGIFPTPHSEFVLSPKTLPKRNLAPAALNFEARFPGINESGERTPAAREIVLLLDRNLVLDLKGLPNCRADLERLNLEQTETRCEGAIVGKGVTDFESAAGSRRPVWIPGKTLLLNGGRHGDVRTLYIVAEVSEPVASVVMPVRVRPIQYERFGLRATISIPTGVTEAVGPLTLLKLKIDKRFTRDGRRASVVRAGCPDGKLQLSTATQFADGTKLEELIVKPCTPRD